MSLGRDLDQPVRAVGHQHVLFATDGARHHVERLVHRAQLGDRAADDLRVGLDVVEREVHDRRARVAGQDAPSILVGDERADRCGRLPLPVRHVEDLEVVGLDVAPERKRDAAQLRRELFVRESGHEQRIPDAGQVGDRRHADRTLQDADGAIAERELFATAIGGKRDVAAVVCLVGCVVELDRRGRYVGEIDVAQRSVEVVDAYEHRPSVVAVPALHREVHVVRHRVHREIADGHVAHRRAEVRRHPLVDVFEIERLRARRLLPRRRRRSRGWWRPRCRPRRALRRD